MIIKALLWAVLKKNYDIYVIYDKRVGDQVMESAHRQH